MRNDPEQDRNHRRRRQVSGNDKPPHATTIVEAFTNGQTPSMTANRAFGLSSGSAVASLGVMPNVRSGRAPSVRAAPAGVVHRRQGTAAGAKHDHRECNQQGGVHRNLAKNARHSQS